MTALLLLCVFLLAGCASSGLLKSNPYSDEAKARDAHDRRIHFDEPTPEQLPKQLSELETSYWLNNGRQFVQRQLAKRINTNKAKNIILFMGDGMSTTTLAATRMLLGGEAETLPFETFPHVGMAKTYCVNYQVPDSACTSTAYLSGVKANYGTIGVNAKVTRANCDSGQDPSMHTTSLAKWAMDSGKVAGLVTTTRVTHASPAGVYASIAERDWESNVAVTADGCDANIVDDVAEQLVYGSVGSKLRVVMGGGRREFLDSSIRDAENKKGARTDGKNLIQEWLDAGNGNRSFVWSNVSRIQVGRCVLCNGCGCMFTG